MKVTELFEARIKGATYTIKEVKGKLDRVTAELSGKKEADWEKISEQYVALDSQIKELEVKRSALNSDIKRKATEIFNVEDEVLTRVVDLADITVTLSKKTEHPGVEKTDADAVVRALAEADLPKELRKIVDKIIKANTEMTDPTTTPERLSVKVKKVDEAVSWKSITTFISSVVAQIKSMLKPFDAKLARIKRKVAAL